MPQLGWSVAPSDEPSEAGHISLRTLEPGSLPQAMLEQPGRAFSPGLRDPPWEERSCPRTSRSLLPFLSLIIPHRLFWNPQSLALWVGGAGHASLHSWDRGVTWPGAQPAGSAPGPQTRPVWKEGFLGGIRRGQLPWGLRWAKGDRAPWGSPLWGRALGRKRAAPLAPSRRHPSAQSVGRAVTRLRLRSWGAGAQRPSPRGLSATSLRCRTPAAHHAAPAAAAVAAAPRRAGRRRPARVPARPGDHR